MNKRHRSNSHGIALIEVLISLLLVSIGFIALAGLQANGIRANYRAYNWTQVSHRAYEMADRMRANAMGVTAGAYDSLTTVPADPSCIATGCTPLQLAQTDYLQFLNATIAQLPLGNAVVCLDSTPNDGTPAAPQCDGSGLIYAIKIWWDADRTGALPSNPQFFLQVRP